MNTLTKSLTTSMKTVFNPTGPVLEIGSRQVQKEGFGDLRSLFSGAEYVGCDMAEGPGVDRVEQIESLSFDDGWAGTVLCLNVIEHVWHLNEGMSEIARVTAPGGAALIVTVFGFHIHAYPDDYWRFTPRALERLMDGFETVLVGWQGPEKHPRTVFALGLKKPLDNIETLADAWRRETLKTWDERPSAFDRFRATVGGALFGKGAFRKIRHYRDLIIRPGG